MSLAELAERFGVSDSYTKKTRKRQLLRPAKARTLKVLEAGVAKAIVAIASQNTAAWFRNCEYEVPLV